MHERNVQALLWPFINSYKKHTGEQISYVSLRQQPELLKRCLQRAKNLGVEELREQAEALLPWLERTAADAVSVTSSSAHKQGVSRARAQVAREHYEQALDAVLSSPPLSVDGRRTLDQQCRLLRIDLRSAETIENERREALGLPILNWGDECRGAVRLLQRDGVLGENDRLKLFDTYLRSSRLSIRHAQNILEEELARVRPTVVVSQQRRSLAWPLAIASVVGAVGALLWMQLGAPFAVVDSAIAEHPQEVVEERVAGPIRSSTVWRAEQTYLLEGLVYVEGDASLTIEPGVRVLGEQGSALIVTRDATLYARGTPDQPIVFTSAAPVGERRRGDWGGVVLLGNAPVNEESAFIEGIVDKDPRGAFGGSEIGANCGVLEYVRIEFAGFEAFANNELNGLTLGGCGHKTIVRNVQVHKALDDGIELFGGDADLRNIVITGAGDDSIDWDLGWQGRGQFFIVQQHGDAGDNGFESDNNTDDHDALPRSAPVLYNVTLLGSGSRKIAQRGMTLRRGTGLTLRNFIVSGFGLEAIDVRDIATSLLAQTGALSLAHGIIFDVGLEGATYAADESGDDDGGFDEASYLRDPARFIGLGVDPMLSSQAFDPIMPDFVPHSGSPALNNAAPIPKEEFFDEAATFLGAVRPGSVRPWYAGWTAFPVD